jgi:hypothetical protein
MIFRFRLLWRLMCKAFGLMLVGVHWLPDERMHRTAWVGFTRDRKLKPETVDLLRD